MVYKFCHYNDNWKCGDPCKGHLCSKISVKLAQKEVKPNSNEFTLKKQNFQEISSRIWKKQMSQDPINADLGMKKIYKILDDNNNKNPTSLLLPTPLEKVGCRAASIKLPGISVLLKDA